MLEFIRKIPNALSKAFTFETLVVSKVLLLLEYASSIPPTPEGALMFETMVVVKLFLVELTNLIPDAKMEAFTFDIEVLELKVLLLELSR